MYDVPAKAGAANGNDSVQLLVEYQGNTDDDASSPTIRVAFPIENTSLDVTDTKKFKPEMGYNDIGFAAAFWVYVVATILVAIFLGVPALVYSFGSTEKNVTSTVTPPLAINGTTISPENDDKLYPILSWISMRGLVAVSLTGIALKDFVRGLGQHSMFSIRNVFIAVSVLSLLSSFVVYMVSSSDSLRGAAELVGVVSTLALWSRPLRTLVPLVRATIRSVSIAIFQNFYVIPLSALSTLVLLAWAAIWGISALGYGSLRGTFPPVFIEVRHVHSYLLLWVNWAIQDVVRFTAAAAVGAWALVSSGKYEGSQAAKDALFRATRNSFGSICMASLLRRIAASLVDESSRHDHQSVLLCLAVRLWLCLVDCLSVFNAYAIIHSALYNSDYLTSCGQNLHLFKHVGWRGFVFDFAFIQVLHIMQAAAATLAGLLGVTSYFVSRPTSGVGLDGVGDSDPATLATNIAIAFGAGFGLFMILSSSVHFVAVSAARTIFVCLVEQPHLFADAHPELYGRLAGAWSAANALVASHQEAAYVLVDESQARRDEEEGPNKGPNK